MTPENFQEKYDLNDTLKRYFAPRFRGKDIDITYEFILDNSPSAENTSSKYYVWVDVRSGGDNVASGTVELAAGQNELYIYDYVSGQELSSEIPEYVVKKYPKAILRKMKEVADLKTYKHSFSVTYGKSYELCKVFLNNMNRVTNGSGFGDYEQPGFDQIAEDAGLKQVVLNPIPPDEIDQYEDALFSVYMGLFHGRYIADPKNLRADFKRDFMSLNFQLFSSHFDIFNRNDYHNFIQFVPDPIESNLSPLTIPVDENKKLFEPYGLGSRGYPFLFKGKIYLSSGIKFIRDLLEPQYPQKAVKFRNTEHEKLEYRTHTLTVCTFKPN